MKQFFSFLAAATISLGAFAQLPNGSVAPDFTATDINGVEHNLYSLLDSGYSVILDFSATWCPPCWSYHQAGTLETIHEDYGLSGSNEVRVFYIESDDSTTDADLNGTGTNTAGDWVTGTQYPIIDDAENIFDAYQCTYYPTIYTVCPNRILTESGQVDVAAHASIFQQATCQPASENNDPSLISYTGDVLSCGGTPVTLSVNLMNNGLEPLTACTITAYDGATAVGSVDWTGSLGTYEFEDVVVTTTSVASDTNFSIEVSSEDENGINNAVDASVITAVESTNNVRLSLLTDAYPGETTWALLDDALNVVAQGGPYTTPGQQINIDWTLDLGCYTFVIEDAFGDGLHASWYNGSGPDGNFSLDAMDGSTVSSTLLSSYSPDEFAVLVMPFEVTSVSNVEEATLASAVTMFPNPTSGLSNIQFTSAIAAKASLDVVNLLGERVIMEDFGILPAGSHRVELSLEGFEAGLYLVNVNVGGEATTLRLTKQ